MKSPEEISKELLDNLARVHGDETFVSGGYAYYEDALNWFSLAIQRERDRAKVLEDYYEFLLHTAEYTFNPDKDLPRGLDPTFYHTLTFDGDLALREKVKRARDALKAYRASGEEK